MDIVDTALAALRWASGFFYGGSVSLGEEHEVTRLRNNIASIVRTCRSILEFYDAQSTPPNHTKHGHDFVEKVLDTIEEYTKKPDEQLRLEFAVLEQTAKYLNVLASGWEDTHRRQQLGRRHEGMIEWTKRFEIKVLGFPLELRRMIYTATKIKPSLVLEVNYRLQEWLALPSSDKLKRAQALLLENANELASQVTRRGDVTFQPLAYHDERLIFASQRAPLDMIRDTPEFQCLVSDMSELAAVFNQLDPATDIRLLKVEYFFYHEEGNQVLFVQTPPYSTASMVTLKEFIDNDSYPKDTTSLTERLKLAHKLAEAVFFCHAAGFLHKSITSSSIVALRPSDPLPGSIIPDLDDSYLMVSDLISESPAGGFNRFISPRWDSDIFRHPDLLEGQGATSYVRAYDVYSLGVVLLHVGLWQGIAHAITTDLTNSDPLDCARELPKLLPIVGFRLGPRYQNLVKWCLDLKGDHIVGNDEFVRVVLGPLEDMATWI